MWVLKVKRAWSYSVFKVYCCVTVVQVCNKLNTELSLDENRKIDKLKRDCFNNTCSYYLNEIFGFAHIVEQTKQTNLQGLRTLFVRFRYNVNM